MLAIRAVEHEEESVAAGLRDQFARLSVDLGVEDDRCLHPIVVVSIVGRHLVIPGHFARISIQSDHRTGPKIIALATLPGVHRVGITSSPIDEIQIGIVAAGEPGHAAAMLHRVLVRPCFRTGFAGLRFGVPVPLNSTSFRISRFEISGNIKRVAAYADDDVVADRNGGRGGEVFLSEVGDLDTPAEFAGSGFERNQMVVGRLEIEPITPNADATITDVNAAL